MFSSSEGREVVQIDGASVDQIHDVEGHQGSAGSPPRPSDSEESDSDNDLGELLLETEASDKFHYNILQKIGQPLHDIVSAGVVTAALSPFLSLTSPYNYFFVTLAYKLGCDGIEGLRALTSRTYPLDGLRAFGNGSLCAGISRTATFKVVGLTAAITTNAIALQFIANGTNNNDHASPSIHDEAAKLPLVGLATVVIAKTTEGGMNAVAGCLFGSEPAELERHPELSKWQLLGGYVVKGVRIIAAGGTIFLYEMYAGDLNIAMNQDYQTMQTLGAILFFQTAEDLLFIPRPLSFLKAEKQHSLLMSEESQLVYVPMTNGQIARMVGINTLKECCSLGAAYGVASICTSFLLPVMSDTETFAPQQDELAIYINQLLETALTAAAYFGVKFTANILPSITSCSTRVTGWASMWSRPPVVDESARVALLDDVETALSTPAPRNG